MAYTALGRCASSGAVYAINPSFSVFNSRLKPFYKPIFILHKTNIFKPIFVLFSIWELHNGCKSSFDKPNTMFEDTKYVWTGHVSVCPH